MTSYEEFEPQEPRGWSPLAVALIATLVLLLGLGGALFGIHVANVNAAAGPDQSASPTPGPTVPTTPPTSTPTVPPATTGPATPGPTTAAGGSFALPDLTPFDFQQAREKVRALKLGWRLVFEGTDADPGVRATDPPAGTQVKRGDTVKIMVKGAAPLATVPAVVGQPCAQAADAVVDHGLYPQYPAGRDGVVLSQHPAATDPPALHWNDQVQLTCGTA